MYDFHIHSVFSNDAYNNATIKNMCEAAIKKGLKGICFTDHVDYDYPRSEENFDFNNYIESLEKINDKYNKRLTIYKGVELGLQPHLTEMNSSISTNDNIDFVIGSIHVVKNKELYTSEFLENISENEGILNYFDDFQKCLSNFYDFDSVGHIDGIRRYLKTGEQAFDFIIYKEQIYELLKKIISLGKGLEINTSAKRYGFTEYHPTFEILSLYKDLGGEIITLGSDAHRPDDIGYDFKKALSLLKEVGFKYYCVFRKRKPIFIKIEQ